MKIVLLAPSDKSFIKNFLPNINEDTLPLGYTAAPFIGTLIKEFLSRGHEVCAITTAMALKNDYKIKEFSHEKFEWVVVPYRPHSVRFNGKKVGRILDGFAYEQKQLIKVLNKVNPDIVHAHWSYEFAGAAIKSKFPYLVTVHDNPFVVLKYFRNFYRFGRLIMAESNLRKLDFATTVSPYMVNYVSKRCRNVKVVPNPIQIDYSIKEIEEFINNRIENLEAPRIFMINNGWDERKNGKKALLAFKTLLKTIPNATLHLYGFESENGGMAYKDAEEIGLTNVFFNGLVPRDILMKKLQTAHLFLHSALEESFGVVLIESMSMGVPVIGGENSGAVPWVIDNPELLLNVSNSELIAEKMNEVLSLPSLYKKLAIKGYKNVSERFSSVSVADSYIKCYSNILNKLD